MFCHNVQSLSLRYQDLICDRDVLSSDTVENWLLTTDVSHIPGYTCIHGRDSEMRTAVGSANFVKHSCEADTLINFFNRYPGGFIDCSALSHNETVIVSIYKSPRVSEANRANDLRATFNSGDFNLEWTTRSSLNQFLNSYKLQMILPNESSTNLGT
jgi:hypothetical protein